MLSYEFHYPLTDFPVAFLLAAATFEMAAYIFKRDDFFTFARWLLWLGTGGAAAAVASGWLLVWQHPDSASKLLDTHHLFAYVSLALASLAVILGFLAKNKPKLLIIKSIFVVTAAITVSLAGYWGGKMAH